MILSNCIGNRVARCPELLRIIQDLICLSGIKNNLCIYITIRVREFEKMSGLKNKNFILILIGVRDFFKKTWNLGGPDLSTLIGNEF